MTLHDIVTASAEVAATSARLTKIGRLAALLQGATPDELAMVVPIISGEPRQGRLGVAWAQVSEARAARVADTPSLAIVEVDAALTVIKDTRGSAPPGARPSN